MGRGGRGGGEGKVEGQRHSATLMIILIVQWAMLSRSKHYNRNCY